jgi:superfamily I DNA/RNA helicase
LSGLNAPQKQAAEVIEGPLLILAGAGSGKTRTITYRIAHMVDNFHIDPKTILGVSFTNKAAKEMRERVVTLLGRRRSRGLTLATFHSLGVKILKQDIDKLGYQKNFSIYDTSDQLALIREAMKIYKADKSFDRKRVLMKIGQMKNKGISSNDFADSPYFDDEDPYDHVTLFAYEYYQDKLRFFNAIDFDDILFLVVRLFRENPDVAKKYSETFQYIMVDEYQDTNPLQFELIRGLTMTHDNLCVVGDDDQAIYSFRGADISNILEFERVFPKAKVVKLEENYRSTTPILQLANKVIAENKARRAKTLWSQKASSQLPILWKMADTDHEAAVVIEEIVQHQAAGKHLGDIALLYRSNTQVQPLEEQLRLSEVPYAIIGGQKFYEKKEIKDLIAYLCLILNPADQISLRRIFNIPNRGIGTVTLEKFLKLAEEKQLSLYQTLINFPDIAEKRSHSVQNFTQLIQQQRESFSKRRLPEAIQNLIEQIDYLKFVEKQHDAPKQVERRKNDIMQFIESAERFEKYHGAGGNILKHFIERLLLQDSQDNQEEEDDHDDDVRKNQVTLMTYHSSKGLEFPIVFMIGVEEESLPHKRTISQGEDISEERRLCYVGITRAQEKLVMTYCKERKIYGKMVDRHPSRFVLPFLEQGLMLHQDRTTFGHLSVEEAEKYKKDFFQSLMDDLES